MITRQAVFSGSWYPRTASECQHEIKRYVQSSTLSTDGADTYVGGIVPHAGWYFSGSIACDVIRSLSQSVSSPDAVVIFGTHLYPDSPVAIMSEGAWETPLGNILIHESLARELAIRIPSCIHSPENHSPDNTIEVQLPLIKYFWDTVKIVPISVPPESISIEAGQIVAAAAQEMGLRIVVVGSTDLTHYGSTYGFTPQGRGETALRWVKNVNDRNVIDAMLSMNPQNILQEARENHNACCAGAAAASLSAGMAVGSTGSKLVAYTTSHEKSPGESFVGYAGILF